MSLSFLRCLLFSIPLIVLSTIVMGSLSVLSSLFDSTGRAGHRISMLWAAFLLKVSFIRVDVQGLEKIRPGESYVFVCNHSSLMDIPAVLAQISTQFRFFAKKGLFSIPFLGTHLRRAGHIPVDRSSVRASLKSMTEAAKTIRQRRISVLLFPEGGRSPAGLRPFKEGAAYVAIKAGVPVVPMAIIGMRPLLPMQSIHIRPGRAILRIGDPVPTAGLKSDDREELTARLHTILSEMLEEPVPAAAARQGL